VKEKKGYEKGLIIQAERFLRRDPPIDRRSTIKKRKNNGSVNGGGPILEQVWIAWKGKSNWQGEKKPNKRKKNMALCRKGNKPI